MIKFVSLLKTLFLLQVNLMKIGVYTLLQLMIKHLKIYCQLNH